MCKRTKEKVMLGSLIASVAFWVVCPYASVLGVVGIAYWGSKSYRKNAKNLRHSFS